MLRILISLFLSLCAVPAFSQETFRTYDDYSSFVDTKIMNREFSDALTQVMNSYQYTPQQIQFVNNQLRDVVPYPLTGVDVIKSVELGNGYRQEMRSYWNDKNSYIYTYAFLHERGDRVVVLHFAVNTSSGTIFDLF